MLSSPGIHHCWGMDHCLVQELRKYPKMLALIYGNAALEIVTAFRQNIIAYNRVRDTSSGAADTILKRCASWADATNCRCSSLTIRACNRAAHAVEVDSSIVTGRSVRWRHDHSLGTRTRRGRLKMQLP